MSQEWTNLAKVVFRRTYSRNDYGYQETPPQTFERAILGNTRDFPCIQEEEIHDLRWMLNGRKGGPAGRGYWFSGTEAHQKLGGVALNSCWGLTLNEIKGYPIAMDLLMLGGGVGASVQEKYVSKLPSVKEGVKVTHKPTKDADYIVPDSREGWCSLLERVLDAYFVDGKSFSYSTVCLRGAGEKIVGFGGVSSGPLPLIKFVETLNNILGQRAGLHIRPIDAADILCAIGEVVVSGNVRRSALLILGDAFDKEYLVAKRWDLGNVPRYRAFANFSVACDDVEDLHPLFWKTYEHGEPFGIVNVKNIRQYGRMGEKKKDSAVIVNPCLAGETRILVRDPGTKVGKWERIDSLVGQEMEVYDSKRWVLIDNFRVTGENQHVYEVKLTNGNSVIATEYHEFYRYDGTKVMVKDLEEDDALWAYDGDDISVDSIKYAGVRDKVYCCTVPQTHTIVVDAGIVIGQCSEATLESYEPCNLQEIFLPNLNSIEEFEKVAVLLHRWGKRITCEHYHHEEAQKVVTRNRRVGTSISGLLQSKFTSQDLDRVYQAIQKENIRYSEELGISPSIRTTVVKPSGTVSKIMDVGAEGIHPVYSRYMIQRIRFAANDPLIPVLREAGHHIEPVLNLDGTVNHETLVVDFYLDHGPDVPAADQGFDTWKQLDTLLLAQKYWADQAVSITVYYKKEDILAIKDWLANNLKYIKAVSFLCHSGHGFAQAPKEAISAQQYDELSSKVKVIDIDAIGSGDLESMECQSGVCPIK